MAVQNRAKAVLILGDNLRTKESLATVLSREGYNVEITQGLGEVVEKALKSEISVLIIDLHLNDISGCEAISIIKKINSKIPIITMTQDNSFEVEKRVRQEGVFFYFVKPFKMEDMKTVVRSAIIMNNERKLNQATVDVV